MNPHRVVDTTAASFIPTCKIYYYAHPQCRRRVMIITVKEAYSK